MISEVYNMDCIEGMKQYPDKYFELAIVDPPYGIIQSGGQKGGISKKYKNRAYKNGIIDKWDIKPNKEYFDELFRISTNQIIWGGNYFDLPPTRCIIFWDKVQPFKTYSKGELAWTSFTKPANLFRLDNRTGNKIHPTQKPIKLYKWLLENYAKEGDKILDTHLGSGSSRIACYEMGYDFVGYELDIDYFEAQEKRFNEFKMQKKLF
jgi:site-specific DNA-methyltransferase (adenine-specific)